MAPVSGVVSRQIPGKAGARALVLAAVLALTVSGCASVNAGSAGSDYFKREFSGDPDVAEVSARGTNDLPWVGSVYGQVVAQDDLDDDALVALINRVGEYAADPRGTASLSAFMTSDDVRFRVYRTRAQNDAQVDLVLGVRNNNRIVEAEIIDKDIEFVAEDPADVFEAVDEYVDDVYQLGMTREYPQPGYISAGTADGYVTLEGTSFEAIGSSDDWVTPVYWAWKNVSETIEINHFQLVDSELTVVVVGDENVSAAKSLIEEAFDDSQVNVSISVVSLGGGLGGTGLGTVE